MLELKKLSFHTASNGKKRYLLQNINLTANEGITAITGANGSGKTTLANLIAGLVFPSQGKIFWNGKNITTLHADERALLGMAYAFQCPIRFQGITVRTLLSLAAQTEDLHILEATMREVGLPLDYLERMPDRSLSGGEAKRVELATALVRNAKITVFDEPEAGIDLWSLDHLIRILQNKKQEKDRLFLLITHEKRILEIADEIVLLHHGEILHQGKKEVILPLLTDHTDSHLESLRPEVES